MYIQTYTVYTRRTRTKRNLINIVDKRTGKYAHNVDIIELKEFLRILQAVIFTNLECVFKMYCYNQVVVLEL